MVFPPCCLDSVLILLNIVLSRFKRDLLLSAVQRKKCHLPFYPLSSLLLLNFIYSHFIFKHMLNFLSTEEWKFWLDDVDKEYSLPSYLSKAQLAWLLWRHLSAFHLIFLIFFFFHFSYPHEGFDWNFLRAASVLWRWLSLERNCFILSATSSSSDLKGQKIKDYCHFWTRSKN